MAAAAVGVQGRRRVGCEGFVIGKCWWGNAATLAWGALHVGRCLLLHMAVASVALAGLYCISHGSMSCIQ